MAKSEKKKKITVEKANEIPPTPASLDDMRHNYTGSWRNLRPEINYDECIQCMICWKFCPEPAIYIEDKKPVIDLYYCKGCGICVVECPKNCIELKEEGK